MYATLIETYITERIYSTSISTLLWWYYGDVSMDALYSKLFRDRKEYIIRLLIILKFVPALKSATESEYFFIIIMNLNSNLSNFKIPMQKIEKVPTRG